jgi:hypothetical protein
MIRDSIKFEVSSHQISQEVAIERRTAKESQGEQGGISII